MENHSTFSQPSMLSPVQNREELVLRLLQHKETLNCMGVLRLGLFGSFARGQQTQSLSEEAFSCDPVLKRAVVRSLEIIGK